MDRRDLFSGPLRRTKHDGRPARLIHRSVDPRQRRSSVTSTRLNDGLLWTRAAWAEVVGLEPVVSWRTSKGERREARPWAEGATSARAYLEQVAASPRGSLARKYLADIAAREGN